MAISMLLRVSVLCQYLAKGMAEAVVGVGNCGAWCKMNGLILRFNWLECPIFEDVYKNSCCIFFYVM